MDNIDWQKIIKDKRMWAAAGIALVFLLGTLGVTVSEEARLAWRGIVEMFTNGG